VSAADNQCVRTIESTFEELEERIGDWQQHVLRLNRATKSLSAAASGGHFHAAIRANEELRVAVARLSQLVDSMPNLEELDLPNAFANGSYLAELSDACSKQGITLVKRDGRVTAFPLTLSLDANKFGVRVGRELERRLRPSILAKILRDNQQRSAKFDVRSFLDRLISVYRVLAPEWQDGEGPLIALTALHSTLTLHPSAAAEYTPDQFLVDILRLDREPNARSTRGHRFEFGGSTGTKGAKRLTVYDEIGARHDYFAIRFAIDPTNA